MASRPPTDQPRARTDPAGPTDTGPDDDQPTFLSMVGLVALVVAVVILVFFGIGYLFGRLFL